MATEGFLPAAVDPGVDTAAAEAERQFHRIDQALAVPVSQLETIGQNIHRTVGCGALPALQRSNSFAVEPAIEAQPPEFAPHGFRIFGVSAIGKRQNQLGADMRLQSLPDPLGGIFLHGSAARTAVKPCQPGKQQFDVVGDFGHGAHRGARGAHRIFAVDGDGRRDALDPTHMGPIHAVHELARIGRKGLHVAALTFGIQGVEGQRGFSRTADPRDDGDAIQGDVQIQVFQVVLSGITHPNGFHDWHGCCCASG